MRRNLEAMPKPLTRLGALLVLVLALTGCETGRSTADPPAPSSSPSAPAPTPSADRLPGSGPGAAAPGLEIRYLDEDGNPQVLRPEDFPRR